jgi:tRNA(Ile)-lysidine synthase TilS/MesJ
MNNIEKIKALYADKELISSYQNKYTLRFPSQHNINGLPILFNEKTKNILLNFSGGADSSLLLYLLCNYIKDNNYKTKIYPITYLRFADSKPWLEKVAVNVYNYLKEMFPDVIQEQIWGFIPNEFETVKISALKNSKLDEEFPSNDMHCDVLCTVRYQEYIMKKYNIDYVYSGTTANPENFIEGEPSFKNISVSKDNIDWAIKGPAINPFAFVQKNWIMAQYHNLNLHELLDITRSCSADTLILGLKWLYNNKIPHECGVCFFCKEKEWAKNNMKDYI